MKLQFKWSSLLQTQYLILLFFALIYMSISFVNHYNFRTYGFDLGIYNNILFDYSKFEFNDNPIMQPRFENVLSDHLSLYHFIYAPFRFLFGSWTLLVFQIASILFGALGIKKLIHFLTENKRFSLFAMAHFLSMWGIYSALSFDYHDNVVASMFVPWLLYYLLSKNWKKAILWTVIIYISKENMSLWLAFIFLGVFVWKFKDKEIRKFSILGFAASIFYFVLAMKVIMPLFASTGRGYGHFQYTALGSSASEIIDNILFHPKYLFSVLFENQHAPEIYDGIKTELHYMVLVSGGIALFYKPQFLIMLIPIYVQKLFHSGAGKWGINKHYSIEFVPILTVAFFYWISTLKISTKVKTGIFVVGIITCFGATISVMPTRKSKWYDRNACSFYRQEHYQQTFNVKKAHQEIDKIPADAKISAQNMVIPHLSFRDDIYMFPHVFDADYVVLLPKCTNKWPLKSEGYLKKIKMLRDSSAFETQVDTDDILIFKRK